MKTDSKKKVTRSNDIRKWCEEMISGPGGFISFEEHEWPMWTIKREQAIAEFIIRCLANRENEGSEYVLKNIIAYRQKKGELTIIQKAFVAGRSKTSWEQFKKDNGLK